MENAENTDAEILFNIPEGVQLVVIRVSVEDYLRNSVLGRRNRCADTTDCHGHFSGSLQR